MRLSIDEVMEQLRIHNISDPSKVRFALVETNGQLSFVLEPAAMPATAQMLSLSPGPVGVPVVLISDGACCPQSQSDGPGPAVADSAAQRAEDPAYPGCFFDDTG